MLEQRDIPWAAAEDAVNRVNEIEYENSKDKPFEKVYLTQHWYCGMCGQFLTGFNAKLQTWECSCSTWYERFEDNDSITWTRNQKLEPAEELKEEGK